MLKVAGVVVMAALTTMAAAAADESAPACITAVVATGCDREPEAGVHVKVVTQRGWSMKGKTDGEGRVEFEVCVEDIAKLKVGGVRADKVTTATVVEETETQKLATITVRVCRS